MSASRSGRTGIFYGSRVIREGGIDERIGVRDSLMLELAPGTKGGGFNCGLERVAAFSTAPFPLGILRNLELAVQ